MASMVIRNIVRQLETPDRLRGRMTGINMIFFIGGPQLGELEAGLIANWFGAPLSVITGGIGCLLAIGWVATTTPDLRHYRAVSPVYHGGHPISALVAVPSGTVRTPLVTSVSVR